MNGRVTMMAVAKAEKVEASILPALKKLRAEKFEEDPTSVLLKRAVIASEDARFADHTGVEWDAIEKAAKRAVAEAKLEGFHSSGVGRAAL